MQKVYSVQLYIFVVDRVSRYHFSIRIIFDEHVLLDKNSKYEITTLLGDTNDTEFRLTFP